MSSDDPEDSNVTRLPVSFRKPPDEERSLLGPYEIPGPRGCAHQMVHYYVDPAEAEVTCGRCGTKLNPMWVLGQLANSDRRYAEARKASLAAQERLAERSRTKCDHCGKMTRISRR